MEASGSLAGGDPLSALPDCLLHEIMSRMKARQVVQTCVLSTRWRHLWRSVPCLDVDQNEFKVGGVVSGDKAWETFEDFTDNLLLRLDIATLDSFRLHVARERYRFIDFGTAAARWIRRAIKYCPPATQRDGLISKSWRLRRLHISNVNLDDSFGRHVSLGCGFLEDLVLENCGYNLRGFTSQTLKKLVLKDCSLSRLSEITAPALESLAIKGGCTGLAVKAPAVARLFLAVSFDHFRDSFSLDEMPSLAKASIHLRDDRAMEYCQLIGSELDIIRSVSNVTSLELSGFGTMVLGKGSRKFPEFRNLRTLLMNNCDLSDSFNTLGHFLRNSPNLEKLRLKLCKFSSDSKKVKGRIMSKSKIIPSFQCVNLKLTEIIYKDDDSSKLAELLLDVLGNLQENYVKLIKVE
ncbi:hypothetical protein ACP70R_029985 [Stipagrostis hirtigluma subsp. patula]